MTRSPALRVLGAAIAIIAVLAILHARQSGNGGPSGPGNFHRGPNGLARQSLTIGYLPVTCHLTCPVTDYASKHTTTGTDFNSLRFNDFPSMTEALKAKQIEATFMIMPLAMRLREQGVPVRICYLGHRDGSTFIVRKDLKARSITDLAGRTIAIPSIYSNQNLLVHKMMQDHGMAPDSIKFVVLAPPDMPSALAAHAIDGYFVGEPFAAAAQVAGTGRILYTAQQMDPNFVSCGLVVREGLIRRHPDIVQDLVNSIASSGKWADSHRAEAAAVAAPYFHQNPKLLRFVLMDPGRVSYSNLTPTNADILNMMHLAVQQGILKHMMPLDEILDRQFVPKTIKTIHLAAAAGPRSAA